ncbi:hypothetical protein [Cellulosilyticum ruminicola]|uniref:hypothetical protein n=1 Tax=Cellulosilyticum ruminicola TaxID=425254 RepID=UPI0006CF780B|nr:hypothetical protein [Cellulosilyticum ruminicola]
MRISKDLWIDEKVKWSRWQLMCLKLYNKCSINGYIICTGSKKQWLFEILRPHQIKEQHKECYVVGIAHSKEVATHHIVQRIDAIYNKQIQDYEGLKT